MGEIKHSNSTDLIATTGSGCGIKPSKEALEKGYEIDFSKAITLLQNRSEAHTSPEKTT